MRRRIGHGEMELSLMKVDIELRFTDIDADIYGLILFLCHCEDLSPLLQFGLVGPFDCSR